MQRCGLGVRPGAQEELYEEDMAHKVHATGMIAQLFRQTENFETLLSHETLLQVSHGSTGGRGWKIGWG